MECRGLGRAARMGDMNMRGNDLETRLVDLLSF
jgi:hypothetical protein